MNLSIVKDNNNTGSKIYIGASKIDESLYQSKYLVQIYSIFEYFNVFLSCSYLMHREGYKCVDNEPGIFYLGTLGKEQPMKCKDIKGKCKDSDSMECQALAFICLDEGILPMFYLTLIVCSLILLTLGLLVAYVMIRRRLVNAQRVNSEVSMASRLAEMEEQMRRENEVIRVEEAKKRILKWIESQLKISKYSDIKFKDNVANTCIICIEDFEFADESKEDFWIVETP
jgi:hypothetical protein